MIAAPQAQRSPFSYYPSPLSFSLLLGEQKQATLEQTVPVSPSLSPLAKQNKRRNSFSSLDVLSRTTKNGQSPSPAVVPECGERAFSGSPLLRQILTGQKRQREPSSEARNSPATPSPIATSSKRFCSHCSNVYNGNSSSMVVLSRKKPNPSKRASPTATEFEQVVPSSSPAHGEDNGQLTSPALNEHVNTYKNGIRLFELFAGADDIFAHHEE